MNKLLLISVLIFFWSCKREDLTEKDYPEEITKNNLQEKFDIAKWELYKKLLNCKGYKYVDKAQKVSNMISCELRYYRIKKKHDTLSLAFIRYCDTSDNFYLPEDCESYNGVGYIGQSNKIRYWEGGEPPFTELEIDFEYYKSLPDSLKIRYVPSGNAEKVFKDLEKYKIEKEAKFREYIKQNKEIINPWLLKKAKQKGVFD